MVVPQQYADIRRALAAEAFAGRGTLDLVELDVYSLAAAARQVTVFDPPTLGRSSTRSHRRRSRPAASMACAFCRIALRGRP